MDWYFQIITIVKFIKLTIVPSGYCSRVDWLKSIFKYLQFSNENIDFILVLSNDLLGIDLAVAH